ncbi:MAG: HNH endonuclease family protein [Patescibacteria group bacterium]|jgi:hypothetical protein
MRKPLEKLRKIGLKHALSTRLYGIVGVFIVLSFAIPQLSLASTITARSLALKLTVHAEDGAGYVRSAFKLWIDADHDGCDTRQEVLIVESKVKPKLGAKCKIISGKWISWYDNKTWTKPADVAIDHVVPLKEAWDSGAKFWTAATRERYANDLSFSWGLDAITSKVNSSKGDKDPAQWLPPLTSARCTYAIHWVAIKYRWKLTVDSAEQKKLLSILSGTCGSRTLTVPTVIATSTTINQNTNANTNTINTSAPIIAPVQTPAPTPVVVTPVPNTSSCCKVCTSGQACGDSCISWSYTCHKGVGCACQG